MALLQLAAHLALDLRLHLQHLNLVRYQLPYAGQALLNVHLLEDGVAVLGLDLEVGGDEIGQGGGIADVGDGGAELVGHRLRQGDDALKAVRDVPHQRLQLQVLVRGLL